VSGPLTDKIIGVGINFGGARYGDIGTDRFWIFAYDESPTLVLPCDVNNDEVFLNFKPDQTTDRVNMNTTGISTGPDFLVFMHPDFSNNLVVDRSGYYQIIDIQDSTVTVEMDVKFSDDNFLKGTFTANRCF